MSRKIVQRRRTSLQILEKHLEVDADQEVQDADQKVPDADQEVPDVNQGKDFLEPFVLFLPCDFYLVLSLYL